MINQIKNIILFIYLVIGFTNLSPASGEIDIVELIEQKMSYNSAMQSVISNNIANANIPKSKAKTLDKFNIKKLNTYKNKSGFGIVKTNPNHLGDNSFNSFSIIKDPKALEITPMGNNIVLNDQMKYASENNIEYTELARLLKTANNITKIALGGGK
jgi:flagellar basal-body rod protein FlgB